MQRQVTNIRDALELIIRQHGAGRFGPTELTVFVNYVGLQLALLEGRVEAGSVALPVVTLQQIAAQAGGPSRPEFAVIQGGKS